MRGERAGSLCCAWFMVRLMLARSNERLTVWIDSPIRRGILFFGLLFVICVKFCLAVFVTATFAKTLANTFDDL